MPMPAASATAAARSVGQQAAGLRDLQRVDIGRAVGGEVERIGGIVHRLVGHDGHIETLRDAGQAASVAPRDGLFDEA